MERKEYTTVDNKYIADAINWVTGMRYYIFTNNEGKIVYSFKNNDQFHVALEKLIEIKNFMNFKYNNKER
ncbi:MULTISPECIES: hypothetical protein [Clostridium]|uniref:hypothetical protein n=1 Tax=Clostridium TaxID=1485 RepID=UPI000825DFCD|nr:MULTISPECIES: hypothetical protein [Clostridium]PJI07661.1 hypothetical protein CUB90_07195 [Clostridium sp. CT7]